MTDPDPPAPLDPAWDLVDLARRALLEAHAAGRGAALLQAFSAYWAGEAADHRGRLAGKDLLRALQRRGVSLTVAETISLLRLLAAHGHYPLLWAPLMKSIAEVVERQGMAPELRAALTEASEAAPVREIGFLRDALRALAASSKERPAVLSGAAQASPRLPGVMATLLDDITDETILRAVVTSELDEVHRICLFGPAEYTAALLTLFKKRREGWWGNVISAIEDRPFPAGLTEANVVALLKGSVAGGCEPFAITIAEAHARAHGVPPALAKAAQAKSLQGNVELYDKKWILKLRALAEGGIHEPKARKPAESVGPVTVGAWSVAMPAGFHLLHAGGKKQRGLRTWAEELDEEIGGEQVSDWAKQIFKALERGAKKGGWPHAVLASGTCLSILVGTGAPEAEKFLLEEVLGLHVDWSGTRKLAGQKADAAGGLAYGGEDIGFTTGQLLVSKDLVVATMAAEEIAIEPLLKGLRRAG